MKLRFNKNNENSGDMPTRQSFRRKSQAQSQRDRDRAARHRTNTGVTTRSQASAGTQDTDEPPEIPRNSETIAVSDTAQSLDMSPVQLNPGAPSFDPCSVSQNHVAEDQCTDSETDNSLTVEEPEDTAGASAMPLFEQSEHTIAMPNVDTGSYAYTDGHSEIHTRENTYLADLDDKVMKDIRCKKRTKIPDFRYADTRTKPLRTLTATIYRR